MNDVNTKKLNKKKAILLFLILAITAGGILNFVLKKSRSNTINLYGNVDIRQVDVSFQVNGVIKTMYFDEGQAVKKGELLAVLDDRDYSANYNKAAAEVSRISAISSNAQSVYSGHQALCREGITSKQECTGYLNSKNEASASYDYAVASRQYAKNQLDNTKVYAPDDGVITSRIQEPGATVHSGQLIYTIVKPKPIWIRTYLNETDLGYVKYGTKTRVITDTIDKSTGKKREYEGRIGHISPVAEFTPKTVQSEDLRTDLVYRINVYVDEADEFLKQGMPVTIKINIKDEIEDGSAKL